MSYYTAILAGILQMSCVGYTMIFQSLFIPKTLKSYIKFQNIKIFCTKIVVKPSTDLQTTQTNFFFFATVVAGWEEGKVCFRKDAFLDADERWGQYNCSWFLSDVWRGNVWL